ncbi:MAG: tetratricopeptide repeat protein [Candidatus Altiarchaeales archaeon]|nr:tetratricopeptide repeat protein [Candidatus Altiarchaeales archaeon]
MTGEHEIPGRKYDDQLKHLQAALELNPENPDTLYSLARIHVELKKPAQAVDYLLQALKQDPKRVEFLSDLSVCFERIGDFDSAIKYAQKAYHLHPTESMRKPLYQLLRKMNPDPRPLNADAYFNQAMLYRRDRKLDEALEYFNQALEEDPNYLDAYLERGYTHSLKRDYVRALKDYLTVAELDEHCQEAHYLMGVAYERLRDYGRAKKHLLKSLELFPHDNRARDELGLVYAYLEDFHSSLKEINKAIEINPNPFYYYDRAHIHEIMGEKKKALKDYQKVVELDPKHSPARNRIKRLKTGGKTTQQEHVEGYR